MRLLVLVLLQIAFADSQLRVRPHVVVTPESQVNLAQLVDGQDLSAELQAQMKTTTISKAPAYGETQQIANANITNLLRPLIQSERTRTGKKINVIIPKTVVIDTTKRGMDPDVVSEEMLQAWQPLCGDCQLSVEGLSLPRVENVRDWTLRMKSELPRGSFSVPVDLVRENGSMTAAWISGRLTIKKRVPVAKRALNFNERVTPQDFTFEFRDISYAIDGIPADEEITGRRMKQGLHVNDILWKGMLERERAVRAGEVVQLKSSEGSWEVTLSMVAQQDAFIGDVINLRNPKTNNVLMGQVVGQGEVELR